MVRPALPLALILALVAGGCERRADNLPIAVSAIGGPAVLRDPTVTTTLDLPQRLMLASTAQGLVRFDASGGIEPGLAERWIVIDDGRSYIFRLREATWPDGKPVTAGDVVTALRRALAPRREAELSPFVEVIDEIVEMTPRIVEVRLNQPRPDLLKLFAQPDFSVVRRSPLSGSGPFRVAEGDDPERLLRPVPAPRLPDEEPVEPDPAKNVRLRGERAALAIARFARRESDLVLGGTYLNWPLLQYAEIAPANVRIDPASGLFGLAVVSRNGFLARPENRAAIAMAIDRAALTAQVRSGWQPLETVLPERLDSEIEPVQPGWLAEPPEGRRMIARNRVAAWHANNPDEPLTVRIALDSGPGATLVWAALARDLRNIGLQPVRVGLRDDADLRLIDAVAPYDSARWYMVTACRLCPEEMTELLDAARDAPTLPERAARLAEADMALAADTAYIPIAQPLRWSLVALRLRAWQANNRAWHPLTHLRAGN